MALSGGQGHFSPKLPTRDIRVRILSKKLSIDVLMIYCSLFDLQKPNICHLGMEIHLLSSSSRNLLGKAESARHVL